MNEIARKHYEKSPFQFWSMEGINPETEILFEQDGTYFIRTIYVGGNEETAEVSAQEAAVFTAHALHQPEIEAAAAAIYAADTLAACNADAIALINHAGLDPKIYNTANARGKIDMLHNAIAILDLQTSEYDLFNRFRADLVADANADEQRNAGGYTIRKIAVTIPADSITGDSVYFLTSQTADIGDAVTGNISDRDNAEIILADRFPFSQTDEDSGNIKFVQYIIFQSVKFRGETTIVPVAGSDAASKFPASITINGKTYIQRGTDYHDALWYDLKGD